METHLIFTSMKKIRIYSFTIVVAILCSGLVGCKHKLLNEAQMAEILSKAYLLEAAKGSAVKDSVFNSIQFQQVLIASDIPVVVFEESLIFYRNSPIQYDAILEKVLENLAVIEADSYQKE